MPGTKDQRKTRHKSRECGAPESLPKSRELYVNQDIIADLRFHNDDSSKAISTLADKLEAQFLKVNPSLPLLPKQAVIQKIQRLLQADKHYRNRRMTKKKTANFVKNLPLLFDIISCKCKILPCTEGTSYLCSGPESCSGFHVACFCPKDNPRIPDMEVAFIKDQREKIGTLGGKQMMEGVDQKEAARVKNIQKKAEKRKSGADAVEKNLEKKRKEALEHNLNVKDEAMKAAEDDQDEDYSPLYEEEEIQTVKASKMKRISICMGPFVAELTRYSCGDRCGAALWNAAVKCLTDAGHLKNEDDNISIDDNLKADKNKIRREKAIFSAEEKAQKDETNKKGIECIGADSKRDKKTLQKIIVEINGVKVVKHFKATEEHVTYTTEPGGEYFTHSTVTDGSGKGLSDDMLEVAAEADALRSLLAILMDGTAVNVGWKSGLHVHVERELQRKLLLLSCMLHANELPLRHLFQACDGGHGTTGPESFAGPMGKACKEEVHLLDLVTFAPITSSMVELSPEVWKDLSSDQKLLYRYVCAIRDGKVPGAYICDNLSYPPNFGPFHLKHQYFLLGKNYSVTERNSPTTTNIHPCKVPPSLISLRCGPINHSRWLTLATRLLILYTRTPNPSDGLKTIVCWIMQVYAPLWFLLKKKNKFIYGPPAIFTAIQLINQQPDSVRLVVKPVVQHNAWFAEVGIMLCAMLASENKRVREKAVHSILKRRGKPLKKPRKMLLRGIRKIEATPLQWEAKTWDQIIDWSQVAIHEPFILEKLSKEQIMAARDVPLEFPDFPLHSQSVERAVKSTSESSTQVRQTYRKYITNNLLDTLY